MMLKIVLLPQPDGPIRLTKRPCGIESVTGASAWKEPVGVLNVMLTSSTQSFGAEDGMRTPLDSGTIFPQVSPRLYRKSHASDYSRLYL